MTASGYDTVYLTLLTYGQTYGQRLFHARHVEVPDDWGGALPMMCDCIARIATTEGQPPEPMLTAWINTFVDAVCYDDGENA
jgi:hypothetical protein